MTLETGDVGGQAEVRGQRSASLPRRRGTGRSGRGCGLGAGALPHAPTAWRMEASSRATVETKTSSATVSAAARYGASSSSEGGPPGDSLGLEPIDDERHPSLGGLTAHHGRDPGAQRGLREVLVTELGCPPPHPPLKEQQVAPAPIRGRPHRRRHPRRARGTPLRPAPPTTRSAVRQNGGRRNVLPKTGRSVGRRRRVRHTDRSPGLPTPRSVRPADVRPCNEPAAPAQRSYAPIVTELSDSWGTESHAGATSPVSWVPRPVRAPWGWL